MLEPAEFKERTRRNLLDTWDTIGYDTIALHEELEGKGACLTGENLRFIIPDYVDRYKDPEWYDQWDAMSYEEREAAFYEVFPKTSRHGM
jgi:hypothetical protein